MRAWIFVYTLFGWIEIYLVDACWLNSKQIEWNDLTIPGWWFTTHYPKIKIKLIGSSLSNVIQWIKLLAVWWLSNRNQFNWCRWQCGRHLTDAWNCFIVSGSWFGIQKSLNIIKQPQTTHTHTHSVPYTNLHGFGVRQMTDKVTVTIKTFQWFHWDRLLLLLLFSSTSSSYWIQSSFAM